MEFSFLKKFKFSATVNYRGTTYFVDCCDTFDHGIELMVFKVNRHYPDKIAKSFSERTIKDFMDGEFYDSISWGDLYVEIYRDVKEAEAGFDRVVKDIGKYIDEEGQ